MPARVRPQLLSVCSAAKCWLGAEKNADDAVERVMYRHRPAVLQDPFLVRVDGEEDDEEVMEMEDVEVVKEVGTSSILHWNYRNLTHLPQELLGEFQWLLNLLFYICRFTDHGGHIQEIYLKENQIEKLPDSLVSTLPCLTHLYLSK